MSLSMGACPHAWHHHLPHRGRMWAASPAFRRQLVLLRSLAPTCADGGRASSSSLRLHAMYAASAAAAGPVYEADAEAVVRRITPPLDRARHKGQAGQ